MERAERRALVEFGAAVGRQLIVPWLVRLAERAIDPPVAFSMADVIVRDIDASWPDWPWERKAEYGRNALMHRLRERGGHPSQADVNKLIELAVERARSPQPEPEGS